jgi:hypothetical protein
MVSQASNILIDRSEKVTKSKDWFCMDTVGGFGYIHT